MFVIVRVFGIIIVLGYLVFLGGFLELSFTVAFHGISR